MKIAVLSNAAVVHTRRWVEHFRARGHDVRAWSLEAPAAGFAAERLPAPRLPGLVRYPLAAPVARRALEAFRPDVVDAHYVPNYGLIGALVAPGRWPLAVSAWGSDLLVAGGRDPLQRWRARFVLRRAQMVLADAANLGRAARRLGAPPAALRVLPWGVDRGRFRPGPARERGLLVSTRMHEPIYDIPVILRAAGRVMARRPETTLALAGDGSLRDEHERLAAACLPAGRWRFLGRLTPDEMAAWLGRADVVLSASRSDSTSLSLLEAMAAGAVPVVSDIEGNREWVRDGEGARLFPVGDAAALEAALDAALDDPDWAERARAHNARVVASRGDWHANMRHVEDAFEALAAGRALPVFGEGLGS